MTKIIECIPNFSEGRDQSLVEALADTAKSVPGVMLLNYSSDSDHNRSVFTLMGSPEGIFEVAFQLCKLASEKIDLTKHSGEHPRLGATDVIPFVPIKEATMEECIEISIKLAKRVSGELGIPVFLYERSATSPERRNLADIRRIGLEATPDFDVAKPHPTAGISVIGARPPLVAYNINLDTDNLQIANAIAKAIRGSSGGYASCKAIGIMLHSRNIAQVSMNIVDYEACPLYRITEAVRFEAKRWGVNIIGSELIGLAPAKALIDCAEYYLQIENFKYSEHVIESHLLR